MLVLVQRRVRIKAGKPLQWTFFHHAKGGQTGHIMGGGEKGVRRSYEWAVRQSQRSGDDQRKGDEEIRDSIQNRG